MKIDGLDWMDWLHKLRADREKLRREKGVSAEDDLKESMARGRKVMAELRARARPPVARDKPQSGN
jgi:hypothetical protein